MEDNINSIKHIFSNDVIEPLTKRILFNLIEQMSNKCLNKNLPLNIFYEMHPDLYKKAESKRKAKYKRKRILILTSVPMNKELVRQAIKEVNNKYKTRGEILNFNNFEIYSCKEKYIDDYDLKCSEEYSDIVLFTKEKKSDSRNIDNLYNIISKNRYYYPNLLNYTYKTCDVKHLVDILDQSLFVSTKINRDNQSNIWNTYAEIDRLHRLLKEQITTANRTNRLMEDVFNRYALPIKLQENRLPYFYDSKILVLGDSRVNMNDLKKSIEEHKLDMDQFDFRLEYDKSNNFDLTKLKGNINYKAVLVGPTPHKVKGDMKASSGLQEMKNNKDLYPTIIELRNSHNDLKITKTSFDKALEDLKSLEII